MSGRVAAGALALALWSLPLAGASAEPAEYETPQMAVDAVIDALEARDKEALLHVFGPEAEDVILTEEKAENREVWGNFLKSYQQMHRIAIDKSGDKATLYVGRNQWPVPIMLVKQADGLWAFDVDEAREEILDRRIGRNELDVIELLRGYVRAQQAFRQTDYNDDGVREFAKSIISSSDRRDGLYWPDEEGVPESPIGDFMARAGADGYNIDGEDRDPEPYLGYYYRLLDAQGENAPGGAMSYLVNGRMLAGHALLAFPSAYDNTGIMTFMVGENGIVYERDLGEDTITIADDITVFDPGPGWEVVEDAEG